MISDDSVVHPEAISLKQPAHEIKSRLFFFVDDDAAEVVACGFPDVGKASVRQDLEIRKERIVAKRIVAFRGKELFSVVCKWVIKKAVGCDGDKS